MLYSVWFHGCSYVIIMLNHRSMVDDVCSLSREYLLLLLVTGYRWRIRRFMVHSYIFIIISFIVIFATKHFWLSCVAPSRSKQIQRAGRSDFFLVSEGIPLETKLTIRTMDRFHTIFCSNRCVCPSFGEGNFPPTPLLLCIHDIYHHILCLALHYLPSIASRIWHMASN